jgi:hypothetical protein
MTTGGPRRLRSWTRPHPGGMQAISPGCHTRGSGRKKAVNPGGVAAGQRVGSGREFKPQRASRTPSWTTGRKEREETKEPEPFPLPTRLGSAPIFRLLLFLSAIRFSPVSAGQFAEKNEKKQKNRTGPFRAPGFSILRGFAPSREFQCPTCPNAPGVLTPASLKAPRRQGGQPVLNIPLSPSRLRAFACELRFTAVASFRPEFSPSPLRLGVLSAAGVRLL